VENFGGLDESGRRSAHMSGAYLSHAVRGYFTNGGGRCYVTRVMVPNGKEEKSAPTQIPSHASRAVPSLTVAPKAGALGDIQVEVAPPTGEAPTEGSFTLKITMSGGEPELYENVNLGKKGKPVAEALK